MMPKGWEKKRLDEVTSLILDGTHFSPKSKTGPYKYVTSKNIRFGRMDLSDLSYISKEEHETIYKRCPVQYGDLLFTKDGANTGNAALNELEEKFSLLSSVAVIRAKTDVTSNIFLLQTLLSPRWQKKIKDEMAGQAITRLTLQKIKSFEVLLPPRVEQQKIAKILSTWDEAIEKLDRLIETRVKEFNFLIKKTVSNPKYCDSHRLGEIADITMGSSPKSSSYNLDGNGLPLIQGNADIKNRRSSPKQFTSEITKECKIGDVLFSVRAPVGMVAIADHQACIGRGVASIRAKQDINQISLYYSLLANESSWRSLSQGSTFEAINSSDLKAFELTIPKIHHIRAVEGLFKTVDQNVALLKTKRESLIIQKQGLMQQLLTGKKRVRV